MALFNPSGRGLAEPMWMPVQIRHRTAYYDAFFAEALMDFIGSGLAAPPRRGSRAPRHRHLIGFCLDTSRERVRAPDDGEPFDVITALAPPPHARMSRFFCAASRPISVSASTSPTATPPPARSRRRRNSARRTPILDQPLIDFYAGYQVGQRQLPRHADGHDQRHHRVRWRVLTWIENLAGDRPFGNDLDPTLNLDVLEACFRNHERWQIVETPRAPGDLRRIVRFQNRLADCGAFTDPRSHIYYLPELYCAYFGRCYAALRALPRAVQEALDPDDSFGSIRRRVLAYVCDDLMAAEMNPFDAALALLALAKLGAEPASFTPALDCLAAASAKAAGARLSKPTNGTR